MQLDELIRITRRALDDEARDTEGRKDDLLWSDVELTGYINEAVNEACERALLIEDARSALCCQINLVAGQAEYSLHPSVIRVKRAAWGRDVLCERSVEQMDDGAFGWELHSGRPEAFIQTASSIRLYRTPRAEDLATHPTVALTVYRTLLCPLDFARDAKSQLPDIKPIYQRRLLDWALHLAYLKPDADAFNPDAAAKFDASFTAAFGVRPDANVQRKRRDKRPPVVRMRF